MKQIIYTDLVENVNCEKRLIQVKNNLNIKIDTEIIAFEVLTNREGTKIEWKRLGNNIGDIFNMAENCSEFFIGDGDIRAIITNDTGIKHIIFRSIKEAYVNNYNAEIMKNNQTAGNCDLKVALIRFLYSTDSLVSKTMGSAITSRFQK